MTEKEFWERVFGENSEYIDGIVQVRDSPGIYTGYTVSKSLDCLFKYAVPKLTSHDLIIEKKVDTSYYKVYALGVQKNIKTYFSADDNHATAVYNALVKVFEQEKKDVNR